MEGGLRRLSWPQQTSWSVAFRWVEDRQGGRAFGWLTGARGVAVTCAMLRADVEAGLVGAADGCVGQIPFLSGFDAFAAGAACDGADRDQSCPAGALLLVVPAVAAAGGASGHGAPWVPFVGVLAGRFRPNPAGALIM